MKTIAALQVAFLREWWGWYCLDPEPDADFFLADGHYSARGNEIVALQMEGVMRSMLAESALDLSRRR